MPLFEDLACEIVELDLGVKIARIRQFPTGLSHFVFDATTDDGTPYVIRIAGPERRQEFRRGIMWHAQIEKIGVRLPKIYSQGEIDGQPYAIYERLRGDDLENVYPSLAMDDKRRIAEEVAGIQRRIAALDRGLFDQARSWEQMLLEIVARSEREILAHGLCDSKYISLLLDEIGKFRGYIQTLKPAAFLYDLSVRNVIVENGKVTGIIDVDDLWFGDPLLSIGRGKTILLAMGFDIEFIEHWCKYIDLSAQEMQAVELYSLLYCVRFMGTIGTKLNGNQSIQTNPDNARLFERLADRILGRL